MGSTGLDYPVGGACRLAGQDRAERLVQVVHGLGDGFELFEHVQGLRACGLSGCEVVRVGTGESDSGEWRAVLIAGEGGCVRGDRDAQRPVYVPSVRR